MTIANPLASVLKASMRVEPDSICNAFNEILLLCDAAVLEALIRQACKLVEDGAEYSITECFAKSLTALRKSPNGAERAVSYMVWGMLENGIYQLTAVMEDIVYPMYLDPEAGVSSVLE